ncbi:MAG: exodeoxyribonuclease VII large subunit, partial [Sphingomonadaceae bacterium]
RTRFHAQAARLSPRLLEAHLARERARLASPRVTPNPALLTARLAAARASLASSMRMVESLSPEAVLARGYALVRLPDGRIARRAAEAASARHLDIRFADGEIVAVPRRSGPGPAPPPAAQGRLL